MAINLKTRVGAVAIASVSIAFNGLFNGLSSALPTTAAEPAIAHPPVPSASSLLQPTGKPLAIPAPVPAPATAPESMPVVAPAAIPATAIPATASPATTAPAIAPIATPVATPITSPAATIPAATIPAATTPALTPAAAPATITPTATPAITPVAAPATIPSPVAEATLSQLRACQNKAASSFTGVLRDQIRVSTVRTGLDGSASVRWQFPNGTYGFCRVSASAGMQEFGVYPGVVEASAARANQSIQAIEICQRRLLQEFPEVAADRLTLEQAAQAQDGSAAFRWQVENGRSGFCSVDEKGGIFEFGVRL